MLDLLFDLPALGQLLVVSLVGLATLAISFVWLGLLHRRFATSPKLLPVGPAFAPVATVFALFLAFLAADVWLQQRQASEAALKESLAFQQLADLIRPDALNAPQAVPLLARYRSAVLREEWQSDFNRQASPAAAGALRDLRVQAGSLSRVGASGPLVSEWLHSVRDLEDARARRLLIGSDHTDNNQWTVVLVLALFAHLVIAASHLDRPPAGRLTLVLFSLATSLALWQLAMHTNPYNGGVTRIDLRLAAVPSAAAEP